MQRDYMDVIIEHLKNSRCIKTTSSKISESDLLDLQDYEFILLEDINVKIRKKYFIKVMQGNIPVLRFSNGNEYIIKSREEYTYTANECIAYINSLDLQ